MTALKRTALVLLALLLGLLLALGESLDLWVLPVSMLALGFALGINVGAWLLASYVNEELARRQAPYRLERRGPQLLVWRLYRLPTGEELELYRRLRRQD